MSFTVIAERNIKNVRKPHWCAWCGQSINAGSPARYYCGSDCGELQSTYMHPECYRAMLDSDIEDELPSWGERGLTLDQSESKAWWTQQAGERLQANWDACPRPVTPYSHKPAQTYGGVPA